METPKLKDLNAGASSRLGASFAQGSEQHEIGEISHTSILSIVKALRTGMKFLSNLIAQGEKSYGRRNGEVDAREVKRQRDTLRVRRRLALSRGDLQGNRDERLSSVADLHVDTHGLGRNRRTGDFHWLADNCREAAPAPFQSVAREGKADSDIASEAGVEI